MRRTAPVRHAGEPATLPGREAFPGITVLPAPTFGQVKA